MKAPTLEVRDLEVRYGAVRATQDVGFLVAKGEVVSIVGPNGAGKSTTMLAMMGALRPAAGDVLLDGQSLVGLSPDVIARRGLALVPEGRRIFGGFTVEENIKLGLVARPPGGDVGEDLAWIYSLFPVVEDMADRRAGHLSGGQQQQLAIARALAAGPRVLLLDEPTLGLAPSVVDTLFRALDEVRRRGVTILLVEQRAQLAVEFADRAYVMRDGRITMQLTAEDVADPERLGEAYFG